jgi:translation initiation factor 2 gamma subunit (eIF-2gamma)
LRRLLGVKNEGGKEKATESDKKSGDKGTRVGKLRVDEMLLINIGSTSLGGKIMTVKGSSNCRI